MSASASNVHVLRPAAVQPQLQHARPGKLFAVEPHTDRIFALLTHAHHEVADSNDIWCVVIASNTGCPLLAGALCKFPRDAAIRPFELVAPLQLAAP